LLRCCFIYSKDEFTLFASFHCFSYRRSLRNKTPEEIRERLIRPVEIKLSIGMQPETNFRHFKIIKYEGFLSTAESESEYRGKMMDPDELTDYPFLRWESAALPQETDAAERMKKWASQLRLGKRASWASKRPTLKVAKNNVSTVHSIGWSLLGSPKPKFVHKWRSETPHLGESSVCIHNFHWLPKPQPAGDFEELLTVGIFSSAKENFKNVGSVERKVTIITDKRAKFHQETVESNRITHN
uniref:Uncharacterized protein n=1 Tax=Parascaris equorum TaxID=6256 RepID=A0A914R3U0_PAREQ